jgi:DNA-binding protein H-NS
MSMLEDGYYDVPLANTVEMDRLVSLLDDMTSEEFLQVVESAKIEVDVPMIEALMEQLDPEALRTVAELADVKAADKVKGAYRNAQRSLMTLMDLTGRSLQELVDELFPQAPTVKWRNVVEPYQTWSGRGKRPAWLLRALDAGIPEAELRVAE